MTVQKYRVLLMVAAALWAVDASAEVKVNFISPDTYTDANLRQRHGKSASDIALREIETFLGRMGETYLAPGDRLTIDVLDVDLAGRFEPWQFDYRDVRFMREITWPEIKLRYRLERASEPPRSGEETVADRGYLTFSLTVDSIGIMPYEKAMLQRWFRLRFAAPASR